MLHDKEKLPPEEFKQDEQKEVKILHTDKTSNTTSPLHGDLSEKPEDENATVRDQDANSEERKK